MKLTGTVPGRQCEEDLAMDLGRCIWEQTKLILASPAFGDLEHPNDEL